VSDIGTSKVEAYAHPGSITVEHVQMPLYVVNVLLKIIMGLDGAEISVVAHRDGKIKDIGDKIWSRSYDASLN
jgi:hypothetical protein